MRLQAFVVTLVMLATFFGCGEGPLAAAPRQAADVTVDGQRTVCSHAAGVWASAESLTLPELRDETVVLYERAATIGTATQKLHVGSATTGVGRATALSLGNTASNAAVDGSVTGALDRFDQAMVRLDADCRPLGVTVVPDAAPETA